MASERREPGLSERALPLDHHFNDRLLPPAGCWAAAQHFTKVFHGLRGWGAPGSPKCGDVHMPFIPELGELKSSLVYIASSRLVTDPVSAKLN